MEYTFSGNPWYIENETYDNVIIGLHIPKRFDKILSIDTCHINYPIFNDIITTIDIYIYRLKNARYKAQVNNPRLNTDGEPLSFDEPADVTESFYIIKNVVVPAGVSLKLEENELRFNNKKYALWVNKTGNYYVDLALNTIKK